MIERIKEILKGIDKDMSEDKKGWWETSTGAGFGAKKLKEIEDLVKLNLLSENQLLKELERLKNESGKYSNNTYFNTGYYTGILDSIDLVKKISLPDSAKEILSDENIKKMANEHTGGEEDYQGFVLACNVIAEKIIKLC